MSHAHPNLKRFSEAATISAPNRSRSSRAKKMSSRVSSSDRRKSKSRRKICFGNTYVPVRKIGSGSFGDIYLGTDLKTGEEIAIKLVSFACRSLSS